MKKASIVKVMVVFCLPILLLGCQLRLERPKTYFVRPAGTCFTFGGQPFFVAGANHHYLHFAPPVEVDNVLDDLKEMGLNVIRMWAFIDIGSLDGVTKKTTWRKYGNYAYDLNTNGVYFQYWDTEKGAVAYNDGPNGLRRLDYAVAEAGRRGFKVILTLTNNWLHLGGIPQYLEWFGLTEHNEFYTDPRCREAYKNWLHHLVNRTNYYTGVTYKNDPTIMSWELMNEPHADGAPVSLVIDWAAEMSAYLKEIDPNHMVGLGDEGFFNRGGDDWKYNGVTGMDFDALLRIPTLDWGSYHLYPSWWGEDPEWGGETWIPEHIAEGNKVGKPVLLGEFGWNQEKDVIYDRWTRKIEELNGAGWIVWRVIGKSHDGTYPYDTEGFDVRKTDSAFYVLKEAAKRITHKNT